MTLPALSLTTTSASITGPLHASLTVIVVSATVLRAAASAARTGDRMAAASTPTRTRPASLGNNPAASGKNKSIVHFSSIPQLFITSSGQCSCAGQKVPEEKGHGRKVHQENRQDRPLYHPQQRRRRLRHAHEDTV